jgi:phosphoribosylaminoimidazolecarboxamide formyltransferase/IMP cyclohydrolase
LIVNLYPFAKATARADCTLDEAIENIDIGGPAMLRAAAKNWPHVAVLIDPADYRAVCCQNCAPAGVTPGHASSASRKKVFAHTAAYDGMITNYLTALAPGAEDHAEAVPAREPPTRPCCRLQLTKTQDMRYGENPHQSAAFYRDVLLPAAPQARGLLASWTQHQGKALSYNNIADADAAWECVKTFTEAPACVIVKHANPCGVAVGADARREAYGKAWKTDPTSAFGGIVAFNRPLDEATARKIGDNKQFV